MKCFSTVRQRRRRKIVIPPSYPQKSFPHQKFSETQRKIVPWRSFFGPVRLKNFGRNREASPLLCLKLSDFGSLSEHSRVLLRILSALWDKDFLKELTDIPFLCIKFCDARKFLKHRNDPQRIFSELCDKKFLTRKLDTPPSLMHKIFHYPNFPHKPKCFPTKFFSTVRQQLL